MRLPRRFALALIAATCLSAPALAQAPASPHGQVVGHVMASDAYRKAVDLFDREHDR